jgi:hypothetical protein
MGGTSKMKEKKEYFETSLSMAAAIKLGTRPSPPTFPKLTVLESQHRLTQLSQHATHESKTKSNFFYAKEHSAQPGMLWRAHHTSPVHVCKEIIGWV